LFSCTVDSRALDHYIHAVTVCNSLALLVSQGSPRDYAVRMALLTTLQKCWLNGHLILKLECSSEGAKNCIYDDIPQDSNISFTSDLGIHFTGDVKSSLSAEQSANNEVHAASAGFTVEPKLEFLIASGNVQEKSGVATDGCEIMMSIYCLLISYHNNCTHSSMMSLT